MPDPTSGNQPTAQELANTVKKVLDPLTIHSFSEATAALAVLQARAEQAERLRALVTEAYDEWGDDGYPTNSWRRRAEELGCWPVAASEETQP